MHIGRVNFTFALLGAVFVSAAVRLPAGEPIRFSGRAGPAQSLTAKDREPFLPTEARTDRSLARPELPDGTFTLPTQSVTPTTGLTRRQLEDQERRRNWFQQSPEALRQDASKSDADRAREARADLDDRENPSPGRHLEGPDRISDPSGRNKSPGPVRAVDRDRGLTGRRGDGQPDARNDGDDRTSRTGWETRTTIGLRGGAENGGWFGPEAARGGGLSRAMAEAREHERERERTASLDAFKRTFSNPWAQPTAGAATAQPTGGSTPPVLAATGGEFRRSSAPGGLATAGRSTTDFSPRSGGAFDPANPLNYGSAATVFRQPEPTVRAAPKPVVLEVPKRKF